MMPKVFFLVYKFIHAVIARLDRAIQIIIGYYQFVLERCLANWIVRSSRTMTVCVCSVIFLVSGCSRPPQKLFEFSEVHMGAPFKVQVLAWDREHATRAVTKAYARVAELNQVFSDYVDESEVNQLGRSEGAVKVSEEMWELLQYSQKLATLSEGAFDVTVGPYAVLWRLAMHQGKKPDARKLEAMKNAVGYKLLKLDTAQRTVTRGHPYMKLDFGAIAKGYAADEALEVLLAEGCDAAVVDAGGDLAVQGNLQFEVGVGGTDKKIHLTNQALATSGSTQRYVKEGNKIYSHIIDPRTGMGVSHQLQVTVLAPTGCEADAWASLVSVVGLHEGLALVEKHEEVEVLIVDFFAPSPKYYRSSGFPFD